MKKLLKGIGISTISASLVVAAAYKIPEQSLNSMALGAAYIAHTEGADTSYFNPANMSFLKNSSFIHGGLTLAHLSRINYNLGPLSGATETENIVIPNIHYVSKPLGDFRWGVSLTAPGGLSKRWKTPFQKASAEEFTLKILELNPTVSYKVSENFSIGGGLRLIYSEGVVKSNTDALAASKLAGEIPLLRRDMEGDTFEFGYNLALSYKPTSDINMAITYRSNIDIDEKGSAKLYYNGIKMYHGDSSVEIPLPASLHVALSKTWHDKFTLEGVYERTYWSKYKKLDFEYNGANLGPLTPVYDTALPRNWKDTDTYRIGATVKMDNKLTAMFGFAIDETPIPSETIGFELPDSDAKIFSMGFKYQQNKQLSWGMALLYDSKDARTIAPGVNPRVNPSTFPASFEEGGAFLTTIGFSYEY